MPVPLFHVIALALGLFFLGVLGFLLRKNAIVMFLSIELMLNSANLLLITFGRLHGEGEGQILTLFVIALAAAEAAVGLALFILLFRRFRSVDVDRMSILRW